MLGMSALLWFLGPQCLNRVIQGVKNVMYSLLVGAQAAQWANHSASANDWVASSFLLLLLLLERPGKKSVRGVE